MTLREWINKYNVYLVFEDNMVYINDIDYHFIKELWSLEDYYVLYRSAGSIILMKEDNNELAKS